MRIATRVACLVRSSFFQFIGPSRSLSSSHTQALIAKDKVEQFLTKAETQSIDPRMFRLLVPELMLTLIDNPSKESGHMASKLLAKVRSEFTPSARIFWLAIEAWLKSSHPDAEGEALTLAEELLTIYSNDKSLHADDKDAINSIFAALIHALLDPGGGNENKVPAIDTAQTLEKRLLELHNNKICEPNTASMNARIALSVAMRNANEAERLLVVMIEAEDCGNPRMAPNLVSYNAVINAFAKVGDDINARSILHQMTHRYERKLSSVRPDVVSFNTLLNASSHTSRRGAAEDAERTLDWMEQAGQIQGSLISPDVYSYTAVIDAYSRSETPERALVVFDRLLKRQLEGYNLVPTAVTFTAVLHALSRSKRSDAPQIAQSLLQLMTKLHTEGADVAPTTPVYNSLLTVWKRHSSSPEVVKTILNVLQEMKTKSTNTKPNRRTYNIVISALPNLHGEHTTLANSLLDEMTRNDDPELIPDTLTYNILLNTLISDKSEAAERRAQEIFSMLKASADAKMGATSQTYNVMMKRASKSDHVDRAIVVNELLDEMEKSYQSGNVSVRPTDVSYTTCIAAWAVDNRPDSMAKAHAILERMKQDYESGNVSARPNTLTYKAILKGYRRVVNYSVSETSASQLIDALMRILGEMQESERAKPDENTYIHIIDILRFLPRRNKQLENVMRKVFDSYQKDCKGCTALQKFFESKDPTLIQFLRGK